MRKRSILAVLSVMAMSAALAAARQNAPSPDPAPIQTNGAAPAPAAAPIPVEASNLLTHSPLVNCGDEPGAADAPGRLRIATWNIQAARSSSVAAIGEELHSMQADVVALQEVDVRVRRTGFVDEPAALAD